MNKKIIIINGSSSFTGYHFIKYLNMTNKYKIICLFSKGRKNSEQTIRINELYKMKNLKFFQEVDYLSSKFFNILNEYKNYILILHYAYNKNYKNDENFKLNNFFKKNILQVEDLYKILKVKCKKIILTNSYFQKNNDNLSFNKYGLSKDINYLIHEYYAHQNKIELKTHTISNPFGIYEEKRFLYHILSSWNNRQTPLILSPNDKNDYILIEDLAKQFVKFIDNKDKNLSISQYYESNLEFVLRIKKIYEKLTNLKMNIKTNKNEIKFDRKNKLKIKKNDKGLEEYIKYAIKNYN